MNKIILAGRLTKDPEIKALASGTCVCNFTMAVRRDFKDKTTGNYESDFFNCSAFGKTAELIGDYCKKGDLFPIWGKSQNRSYDKDGHKVYINEVMVEGFDFPPKNSSAQSNESPLGKQVNMDEDIPF